MSSYYRVCMWFDVPFIFTSSTWLRWKAFLYLSFLPPGYYLVLSLALLLFLILGNKNGQALYIHPSALYPYARLILVCPRIRRATTYLYYLEGLYHQAFLFPNFKTYTHVGPLQVAPSFSNTRQSLKSLSIGALTPAVFNCLYCS